MTTSGTITWAYTWDAANHLLKVSSNGVTQGAYAYDGRGRQVEGVESSSTTFYAYLGTEVLFRNVYNQFGVDYLYAGGMRIATVDSSSGSYNTVKYFHEDALGSTRLVTASSGSVTFADSYQPFGQDNGAQTGSEIFKFTGKPVSQTTGLYYDYQRWYDLSIGRFISQDPIGGRLSNPQSLDRYVYVKNIPTTFTDPTGLAVFIATLHGHTSCPTLFQDFWGSLRCSIFGPAAVAGVTGGGAGGVGPATINPTPAGAIIVAAVWAYWLYTNWDNIWRSPERVEPTVIPPTPGGKVPTTVPTPPDPTLRLPVGGPTAPGTVAPDGSGDVSGQIGQANIYDYIAKVIRTAKNNPNTAKIWAVGAAIGLTTLFIAESVESAKQSREPPDPEGLVYSALIGCLFVAGAAALIPT